MDERTERPAFRADIEALRGVAVMAVIAFHAAPAIMRGGFRGVDVFFVISGYLITALIRAEQTAGRFRLLAFIDRRIRRILPMVIVIVLSALALGWLIMRPDELAQLGQHSALVSGFALNFGLIQELGYFDVDSYFKPLLHLWSLSVEEQFYLIWPLALLLCFKSGNLSLAGRVAIGLGVVSLIGFIALALQTPDVAFYNSLTRTWQFAAGAWIALRRPAGHVSVRADRANWAVPSGVALMGIAFVLPSNFLISGAIVSTLGTVLFIIGGTSRQRWFGLRPLGRISYSLYLWHWVLLSFVAIYSNGQAGWVWIAVAIGVAILLSIISYVTIERLRHVRQRGVSAAILITAMAVGGLGYSIWRAEGLPERPQLQAQRAQIDSTKRTSAKDEACAAFVQKSLTVAPEFLYCRATPDIATASGVLVVLGDSHAHAAYPGLAEAAQSRGYAALLLGSSSCPPLPRFGDAMTKAKDSCGLSIEQRLVLIEIETRPVEVVMFMRGPTYIHGELERPFTDATLAKVDNRRPQGVDYELLEASLQRTIERLSALSHLLRIVIITENPEMDFKVQEALPRPFDYYGLSLREASVSRALHDQRMARFEERLGRVANSMVKTILVDLDDEFCDKDRCYVYRDGVWLYADDDHLSVDGSRIVARALRPYILTKPPFER